MKHLFKYLGEDTRCFKNGQKYPGRVMVVDDCSRLQSIKFDCAGETVYIKGADVGNFKIVETAA